MITKWRESSIENYPYPVPGRLKWSMSIPDDDFVARLEKITEKVYEEARREGASNFSSNDYNDFRRMQEVYDRIEDGSFYIEPRFEGWGDEDEISYYAYKYFPEYDEDNIEEIEDDIHQAIIDGVSQGFETGWIESFYEAYIERIWQEIEENIENGELITELYMEGINVDHLWTFNSLQEARIANSLPEEEIFNNLSKDPKILSIIQDFVTDWFKRMINEYVPTPFQDQFTQIDPHYQALFEAYKKDALTDFTRQYKFEAKEAYETLEAQAQDDAQIGVEKFLLDDKKRIQEEEYQTKEEPPEATPSIVDPFAEQIEMVEETPEQRRKRLLEKWDNGQDEQGRLKWSSIHDILTIYKEELWNA